MSSLSSKEKIILTVVGWVVASGGLVLGVVFPLYLRLQNFPITYRGEILRLQELEFSIEKIRETESEYAVITARTPLLASQFLKPDEAITFIESLETLAKGAGLYKEIQLGGESGASADAKAAPALALQVTLVGSFERVMKFLAEIENFTYAIDIERVNFVPVKSSQTYGQAEVGGREVFTALAGDVAVSILLRVHSTQ